MIVAWDDSWALYTPTKTGTYSLEGTLIEVLEVGVKVKPRHRMDVAASPPGSERAMIVRHPIERWASIYWAIHRWTNSGSHPYMWQFIESPEIFAREYFRRIDAGEVYPMYTNNNVQNMSLCRPKEIFKTENLDEVLVWIEIKTNRPGLAKDTQLKHLNHTKDRPSAEETLGMLSPKMVSHVLTWATPDMERWYGP